MVEIIKERKEKRKQLAKTPVSTVNEWGIEIVEESTMEQNNKKK